MPGRIEVFGKHTDYAGGASLVGAVPRGFAIVAGPRDDRRVRVIDARWDDEVAVDPAEPTARFTGWRNYVAVVALRLAANFPGAHLGTDIALVSNLPRAAGLSSSSALVVGLATAMARRADLAHRAEWRAAIVTPLDLAGYLGAVENGLTFPSLPGTSGVGTHGGSEDHTAILTCRADRLSAYRYVPVRETGHVTVPEHWRFIIAASGVQADKAGSAKDRYNRASLATRALVDIWNERTGAGVATLAEALASGEGASTELLGWVDSSRHPDFDRDTLHRRLRHFVAENARIPLALEAFGRADRTALTDLADGTQHDADALLGNQIAETRTLAALAREQGAFAASSFGAGFGGSVWALAESADAAGVAERWMAAYGAAYPALGPVEWFICRPAPGMREMAPPE